MVVLCTGMFKFIVTLQNIHEFENNLAAPTAELVQKEISKFWVQKLTEQMSFTLQW